MKSWCHLARSIGVVSGVVSLVSAMVSIPLTAASKPVIRSFSAEAEATASSLADLPNGAYQFCTEPAPQDWRDGAGACLTIVKTETAASGYYGYPHSESFICLEGEISKTGISGKGMAISWTGSDWTNVPESSFYWDEEGRLFLAEGNWAKQEENIGWIVFQQAELDTRGLYQYERPQMTPPERLCNWQFELSENR